MRISIRGRKSARFGNVEVMPIRFEEARFAPDFAEVITARAVGGFPDILRWRKQLLRVAGT